MARSFSILIAEPSLLLREKIACVLARDESVWCVTQVGGRRELVRGVGDIHPDFILADLAILNDLETVRQIKEASLNSRIFALVDSDKERYMAVARRLNLDGIIEKGHAAESIKERIRNLVSSSYGSDDETD